MLVPLPDLGERPEATIKAGEGRLEGRPVGGPKLVRSPVKPDEGAPENLIKVVLTFDDMVIRAAKSADEPFPRLSVPE